jgi:hypothetical protein
VGAVDHEVVGTAVGVDLGDGRRQWCAVGQPAVLLDGERDRHRQPGRPRGADDAHRLAGPRHGQDRDQVDAGLGQCLDLGGVVGGGVVGIDYLACDVPIALGPEAAADQECLEPGLLPHALEQADGVAVHAAQLGGGIPETVAPVLAGTPRRRLQLDCRPSLPGDVYVLAVVAPQQVAAPVAVDEHERSEVGESDVVVVDQVGLQAAVGHDRDSRQLGPGSAVHRFHRCGSLRSRPFGLFNRPNGLVQPTLCREMESPPARGSLTSPSAS